MVVLRYYYNIIRVAQVAPNNHKTREKQNRKPQGREPDHFIIALESSTENCLLLLSFSTLIFIEVLIKFSMVLFFSFLVHSALKLAKRVPKISRNHFSQKEICKKIKFDETISLLLALKSNFLKY